MIDTLFSFLQTTGFSALSWENLVMFAIAGALFYVAIVKEAEPLLLIPIAFGIVMSNIPHEVTGLFNEGTGLMWFIQRGLYLGIYPPLIFLGIGALTDFSFLLSNPKTLFLGAAAQVGIFISFITARFLGFSMPDAASIGIIGGADGPTSIYVASQYNSPYLAIIAIAAYSYIALIPIIQPPIMKLLTTKEERKIKMGMQLRHVSKLEKIVFSIVGTIIIALLVPKALPLIGMLMFGNILRENGLTQRLAEAASKYISDTAIILLCLSVGAGSGTNADGHDPGVVGLALRLGEVSGKLHFHRW